MNTMKRDLIEKFRAGLLTQAEQHMLESMIEKEEITLEELSLENLQDKLIAIEPPVPSMDLDHKFYAMLAMQRKSTSSLNWWSQFKIPTLVPRFGLAAATLLIGLAVGYFLRPTSDGAEMSKLSEEVTSLKEMMMLSLLEKESATDRLKAVSLTQDMDQASQKVTAALIQTLNHDDNVNVRLAALDALHPYVKDSSIRQELIRSIAQQRSPLVQVALAELMVAIQEKSSVKELKKLLDDKKTPRDVKKKIEQSIDVLI
ncbi:HEAT repeat domain-containing protein [Pseudochryseolinea flava]|nr:HEAT repeat domain-containing protein [Pseudochryseolinea flava]